MLARTARVEAAPRPAPLADTFPAVAYEGAWADAEDELEPPEGAQHDAGESGGAPEGRVEDPGPLNDQPPAAPEVAQVGALVDDKRGAAGAEDDAETAAERGGREAPSEQTAAVDNNDTAAAHPQGAALAGGRFGLDALGDGQWATTALAAALMEVGMQAVEQSYRDRLLQRPEMSPDMRTLVQRILGGTRLEGGLRPHHDDGRDGTAHGDDHDQDPDLPQRGGSPVMEELPTPPQTPPFAPSVADASDGGSRGDDTTDGADDDDSAKGSGGHGSGSRSTPAVSEEGEVSAAETTSAASADSGGDNKEDATLRLELERLKHEAAKAAAEHKAHRDAIAARLEELQGALEGKEKNDPATVRAALSAQVAVLKAQAEAKSDELGQPAAGAEADELRSLAVRVRTERYQLATQLETAQHGLTIPSGGAAVSRRLLRGIESAPGSGYNSPERFSSPTRSSSDQQLAHAQVRVANVGREEALRALKKARHDTWVAREREKRALGAREELWHQLTALTGRWNDARATADCMAVERDAAIADTRELRAALAKAQGEAASLRASAGKAGDGPDKAASRATKAEAQLAAVRIELADAKRTHEEQLRTLQRKADGAGALPAELLDVRAQLSDAKKAAATEGDDANGDAKEGMMGELAEARATIASLEAKLDALRERLEERGATDADSAARVAELERSASGAAELAAELVEVRAKLAALEQAGPAPEPDAEPSVDLAEARKKLALAESREAAAVAELERAKESFAAEDATREDALAAAKAEAMWELGAALSAAEASAAQAREEAAESLAQRDAAREAQNAAEASLAALKARYAKGGAAKTPTTPVSSGSSGRRRKGQQGPQPAPNTTSNAERELEEAALLASPAPSARTASSSAPALSAVERRKAEERERRLRARKGVSNTTMVRLILVLVAVSALLAVGGGVAMLLPLLPWHRVPVVGGAVQRLVDATAGAEQAVPQVEL